MRFSTHVINDAVDGTDISPEVKTISSPMSARISVASDNQSMMSCGNDELKRLSIISLIIGGFGNSVSQRE